MDEDVVTARELGEDLVVLLRAGLLEIDPLSLDDNPRFVPTAAGLAAGQELDDSPRD